METKQPHLLGYFPTMLVGPTAIVAVAALLLAIDYAQLARIPNPTMWFIVVLVSVSLTGDAVGTVISFILALAGTLWLFGRLGYLTLSTSDVIRLVSATVAYGAVTGVVLVIRRRLIEAVAAPAKAEQLLFRAVMASMHDAIFETGWKGIQEVNDSFCRMTGFSREELLGAKAPFPFWPPEEYATIAAALETSMRGRGLDFELVLTRKNGERFPVLLSVSRIDSPEGKTHSRVLYSFRDITELKRAQHAAETANRTKDELLNVLTNELQKPLTPILAMARALESEDGLSPESRGKVEAIRRNAEAEACLIAELLERVRGTHVGGKPA